MLDADSQQGCTGLLLVQCLQLCPCSIDKHMPTVLLLHRNGGAHCSGCLCLHNACQFFLVCAPDGATKSIPGLLFSDWLQLLHRVMDLPQTFANVAAVYSPHRIYHDLLIICRHYPWLSHFTASSRPHLLIIACVIVHRSLPTAIVTGDATHAHVHHLWDAVHAPNFS